MGVKVANRGIWMVALGIVLAFVSSMAFAQLRVGQVEFVQGLTTAQRAGSVVRFIGSGDALFEGDVVTTTDRGYAILALADGTKITLRPSTSFAIDKFAHGSGSENVLLRLVKGGLRAITGLVGKRNPDGVKVTTVTATIGIRGTSFDARLCGSDCSQEQSESRPGMPRVAPVPAADTVIGRVVRLTGEVSAVRQGGAPRPLSQGAPVLVGDEIITGRQATAVIGFRDQSRVALEPQTVFRVDSYSFGRGEATDNVAMRLLKGGLRAFSGLIGKRNPSAVSVSTVVATLGIRGTGMDISCEGPCAAVAQPIRESCTPAVSTGQGLPGCGDGMFVHTWEGKAFINDSSKDVDVDLGRVGFAGVGRQARLLSATPSFMNSFVSPRPDTVEIDWAALFGFAPYAGEEGLYTLVRDGFIYLEAAGGRLDIGPGEGGMVGADGKPRRLFPVPAFLSNDPYPPPENFDPNDPVVLQIFGATMGNPGQNFCAIP